MFVTKIVLVVWVCGSHDPKKLLKDFYKLTFGNF